MMHLTILRFTTVFEEEFGRMLCNSVLFQLVHFVNRDSLGLANDFLSLGFIPEGVDIQLVSDALKASFGDGKKLSQDFQVCLHFFSC